MEMKRVSTYMHEILDWIYSIVVALFLAMLIHIFLFVPTKVSGSSMYPTLTNGEYLIVSKISHVLRETPNYGDIVIIDSRTHRKDPGWMISQNRLIITLPFSSIVLRVIISGSNALSENRETSWNSMTDTYIEMVKSWMNHISMNQWNFLWTDLILFLKAMYSSWGTTGTTALTAVSSGRFRSIMSLARYACSCNPVRHTASMRFWFMKFLW